MGNQEPVHIRNEEHCFQPVLFDEEQTSVVEVVSRNARFHATPRTEVRENLRVYRERAFLG